MGTPTCPGCRERDRRIAVLERRVAELEALMRDLQARLDVNAINSSVPPSANPPGAPKPVVKAPTGRKPGGQPGHAPCMRVRLPAERVHRVVRYLPATCHRCQMSLPVEPGPADPEPSWHQVAELPEVTARITEHQGHARHCRACGAFNHAPVPAAIRAHAHGPRLAAVMAYLSGARHDSKRGVEEVVATVFGVPLALGTVSAVEQEVSAALATAHAEAGAAVRQAQAVNVDETGWKQAGHSCWLWTAVSAGAVYFVIHARRGAVGLAALLGPAISNIVTSDRGSAYQRLALYRRQLCWAHLRRDYQAMSERPGPAGQLGGELLGFTEDFFHDSRRVRDGTLKRSSLRQYLQQQRRRLQATLGRGLHLGCPATTAVCRDFLRLEPALWTFAHRRGAEPRTTPSNAPCVRLRRSAPGASDVRTSAWKLCTARTRT